MGIQKTHTFQNCTTAIEDIANPEDGNVVGRALVIMDQEGADVWRLPMPIEVAEAIGKRLQGDQAVEVATPAQADAVAKQAAKVARLNQTPKR